MWEFLATPPAQAVMSVAVLLILIAIGFYLVRRFAYRADEDQPDTHEHLTNFREMHHQGDIDETEFRNIKTVLGAKLHSRNANESPEQESSEKNLTQSDTPH